jgi:hypothetical protein
MTITDDDDDDTTTDDDDDDDTTTILTVLLEWVYQHITRRFKIRSFRLQTTRNFTRNFAVYTY